MKTTPIIKFLGPKEWVIITLIVVGLIYAVCQVAGCYQELCIKHLESIEGAVK